MSERTCEVLRVDVFTKTKGQGNPVGLVLDGDDWTRQEMQEIAKQANFNETVFVCSSKNADLKLRFFMPLKETDLCGHGTIGAMMQLFQGKDSCSITIETNSGILEATYNHVTDDVTMKQKEATFRLFTGDKGKLSEVLKIEPEDISNELPIVYGNTGVWTLLVPVINEGVLDKMVPRNKEFPKVLKEMPDVSIHPFVVRSVENRIASARHFSAFNAGSVEDAVTGTASGVMGAYLLNWLYVEQKELELLVYQGKQMEQEGLVRVTATKNGPNTQVAISGTACLNSRMTISLKS